MFWYYCIVYLDVVFIFYVDVDYYNGLFFFLGCILIGDVFVEFLMFIKDDLNWSCVCDEVIKYGVKLWYFEVGMMWFVVGCGCCDDDLIYVFYLNYEFFVIFDNECLFMLLIWMRDWIILILGDFEGVLFVCLM